MTVSSWLRGLSLLGVLVSTGACGDYPSYVYPPPLEAEKAFDLGAATPPVQGGTLLAAGEHAVAADPARDAIHVVDLATQRVVSIQLEDGAEPGRAVLAPDGYAYVALRGTGEVIRIDLAGGSVASRRYVCPSASGLTYHPDEDSLLVACTTGELVWLPMGEGAPTRIERLEPDLRDVAVFEGLIYVSHFRSAKVRVLGGQWGPMTWEPSMATLSPDFLFYVGRVAWTMRAVPNVGVVMLHQLHGDSPRQTPVPPSGQGSTWGAGASGACSKPVFSVLSIVEPNPYTQPKGFTVLGGTLITDFAISPDGAHIALAATGESTIRRARAGGWLAGSDVADGPPGSQHVVSQPRDVIISAYPIEGHTPCAPLPGALTFSQPGEVTAVAFDGDGALLTQMREPSLLVQDRHLAETAFVELSEESVASEGHVMFHAPAAAGVACASCHPAGGDDGHRWQLTSDLPRRTQSLAGTLRHTAPYHWEGELSSLDAVVDEVFVGAMRAATPADAQRFSLFFYLQELRRPRAARADPLSERGRELFHDDRVGCASCHSGSAWTNNATVDVGTGGPRQVPSLVGVGTRPPFMSSGCAHTLEDRFAPTCGGEAHGVTDHLSEDDLSALAAFMRTL